MYTEIKPTEAQLNSWIEACVPEKDFFFATDKEIEMIEEFSNSVLTIPREEFRNHSSYNTIKLVNSFQYWQLSKEYSWVIIAGADWIETLPINVKEHLLKAQFELNRGLVLPISYFKDARSIPETYHVTDSDKELIVLQKWIWDQLEDSNKINVVECLAKSYDSWNAVAKPANLPEHIAKYANSFTTIAGSNCLSSTLFAISKSEWMTTEWVHPKTFLKSLENHHYQEVKNRDLKENDVLVWTDENKVVQHASFHIKDQIFFNKNGQTTYNPWKLVEWTELKDEWKDYHYSIYRKAN